MSNIVIFYGSRIKFDELLPNEYRTLTDLVYENDKETKNMVIYVQGQEPEEEVKNKIKVKNFVVGSDEYGGVREHVIVNFNNFLSKFDYDSVFLHNPPLQISTQIERLFSEVKIIHQEYSTINISILKDINLKYDDRVIGQNGVKLELLQSLFPLTLPNRTKPVVVLLYGRSGIGKTETAKIISEIIGEALFRKQFSMYQNSQFSTYLFGGAHYERSFAKDLLDRESNVLLLDEFDKAHPSFHSAFYQLFDEGIYEDHNYKVVVNKAIIVCTSNYKTIDEIKEHLGLPIYNRFDSIIKFDDLPDMAKEKIAEREIERLKKDYGIEDRELFDKIKKGAVTQSNAREIKHLIKDTFSLVVLKKICGETEI